MPMMVSVMGLAGSQIESGPPGHTKSTCLYAAGIVVAHEVHHKSRNVAAVDGWVLDVKMSRALQTVSSGASVASLN